PSVVCCVETIDQGCIPTLIFSRTNVTSVPSAWTRYGVEGGMLMTAFGVSGYVCPPEIDLPRISPGIFGNAAPPSIRPPAVTRPLPDTTNSTSVVPSCDSAARASDVRTRTTLNAWVEVWNGMLAMWPVFRSSADQYAMVP